MLRKRYLGQETWRREGLVYEELGAVAGKGETVPDPCKQPKAG